MSRMLAVEIDRLKSEVSRLQELLGSSSANPEPEKAAYSHVHAVGDVEVGRYVLLEGCEHIGPVWLGWGLSGSRHVRVHINGMDWTAYPNLDHRCTPVDPPQ